MKNPSWTQEDFLAHYSYDPDTGLFTVVKAASNRTKVGRVVGSDGHYRYIDIRFRGQMQRAHRVAWWLMTGAWPSRGIDHINLDGRDNRWSNLRLASHSENLCNQTGRTALGKNIYLTACGTYQVKVTFEQRERTKTFKTLEEAQAFAEHLRIILHREFARS